MFRIVVMCITFILCRVGYWRIFEEHGIKGWYTFIPFFGMYQYYKLTMGKGLLVILSYIPIANLIVSVWSRVNLSKMYEHGIGFTIGIILLPAVFLNLVQYELVEEPEPERGQIEESKSVEHKKEEKILQKAVLNREEKKQTVFDARQRKNESTNVRAIYRDKSNVQHSEERKVRV